MLFMCGYKVKIELFICILIEYCTYQVELLFCIYIYYCSLCKDKNKYRLRCLYFILFLLPFFNGLYKSRAPPLLLSKYLERGNENEK